jgi:calcium permeable stress-gated cation channel
VQIGCLPKGLGQGYHVGEFSLKAAAHEAFQIIAKKSKTEFSPCFTRVQPKTLWNKLTMGKAQRKARMTLTTTLIILLTLFWTTSVSFIGALTNVNDLISNVPFLGFIDNILPPILGVPTVQ